VRYLIDNIGRTIDYIRISVTDRCNLRCKYCMPDGFLSVGHSEILTYEEIMRLSSIMLKLGIRNIKITGGEPLVRKGICNLIKNLKSLPGMRTVTMTTNGVLLEEYLDDLVNAGLDGVNISLDTLDREKFEQITGTDALDKVLISIEKAIKTKIKVKINCVPIPGFNEEDIVELAGWTLTKQLDVRFIEMMPIGAGRSFQAVKGEDVLKQIERVYGPFNKVHERRGNGPARYYNNSQMKGCIGIINAVNHSFCEDCNRIRLTSEGFLKQCLYYNKGIDLKSLLRNGKTNQEILKAIELAVKEKPEGNSVVTFAKNNNKQEADSIEKKNMSQIGG